MAIISTAASPIPLHLASSIQEKGADIMFFSAFISSVFSSTGTVFTVSPNGFVKAFSVAVSKICSGM